MDFDLTDDQKEIKRVAKELLAARSSFAKVREAAEASEYDAALWQELGELGWAGVGVAQEAGAPEQQARWLPELASGEKTAAIGTADLLADGVGAAVAVVIDGSDAYLVESPQAETLTTIDSTRRLGPLEA